MVRLLRPSYAIGGIWTAVAAHANSHSVPIITQGPTYGRVVAQFIQLFTDRLKSRPTWSPVRPRPLLTKNHRWRAQHARAGLATTPRTAVCMLVVGYRSSNRKLSSPDHVLQ